MDLRTFEDGLTESQRCEERRKRIERECGVDLAHARIDAARAGDAPQKNCEQMFGHVPVPVGLAGPLKIVVSSEENIEAFLPLATTEGALVASVNRGCKAVSQLGVRTRSIHHGMTRSICMEPKAGMMHEVRKAIETREKEWKKAAASTSRHLQVVHYELEESGPYLFLTISCDTGDAMGMNMTTLAAGAVGTWIEEQTGARFVTEAANVDSDKKPSLRTKEKGRGFEVSAEASLPADVLSSVLKTTPDAMMSVYEAKLLHGSKLAGAVGRNCHAANVIAALFLATGQDPAHVAEGSLADTTLSRDGEALTISVRLPAVLVGVIGGGTTLPAQAACLSLLRRGSSALRPTALLAEIVGGAVLAGETSLLAALSSRSLGTAHKKLGRTA